MKTIISLLLGLIILFTCEIAFAQSHQKILNKKEKKQSIEKICELLNRFYVFPEIAKEMEQHLNMQEKNGKFKDINEKGEFARTLTKELRSVQNDKHLHLYIGSNPDIQNNDDRNLKRLIRELNSEKDNHGINKIEILEGNIGYIRLNSVMYSDDAMSILNAAMQFLSNTYSIIFDLRVNSGGDPMYMAYLFSYFFENPTHINSIYWKDRDRTDEFWTKKEVPGKKMTDIPLYVLISKKTFSGAEEFAYDLQSLKRATIVGEISAGGANPAATWVISNNLRISIPYGRAINPITGTNWEGTGVIPDIKVPADQALEVAIEKAKIEANNYYDSKKATLISNYNIFKNNIEKADSLISESKYAEAESLIISSVDNAIKANLLNQSKINRLGYDCLNKEKKQLAIALFKANVMAYPDKVDVYDSLGEAYLENGNKELAIEYYKKALEIDPKYPTAIRALEELTKYQ